MVAPDGPAGSEKSGAANTGSRAQSTDTLQVTSRGLWLAANALCLGLLFYGWFAGQVQLGQLLVLCVAANVAVPWPRIRDLVRQHSVVSALFCLLGVWLAADTLLSYSSGGEPALYRLRNVFQGTMFLFAGLSNLVVLRVYPARKTTRASLCCAAVAVAAGTVWVCLGMHRGALY